jgi:hypothetical protein
MRDEAESSYIYLKTENKKWWHLKAPLALDCSSLLFIIELGKKVDSFTAPSVNTSILYSIITMTQDQQLEFRFCVSVSDTPTNKQIPIHS